MHKGRVLPGIVSEVRGWPSQRDSDAPPIVFTAQERLELLRLAQVITFRTPGSLIYAQGDEAAFTYLLAGGVVTSYHSLRNGERQVLAFHWTGDMFGLAEHGRYVGSAQTLTPAQLLRFPSARLEQFLLEHPRVQNSFMLRALHEVRRAQRQLIAMGKLDIPRRLALFLVDCSARKPYFSARSGILRLPMSRDDIADYLGTSPETVIRALTRLERSGMIERISPRELKLHCERLNAFAGFEPSAPGAE